MIILPLNFKLHFLTQQISCIPFRNPIRIPQTIRNPFLRIPPIQSHKFSIRKNANIFKTSSNDGGGGRGGGEDGNRYSDSNGDGNGGGDGDNVVRLFMRWVLNRERGNVVAVRLPGRLAWLCVEVIRKLFLAMMEAMVVICGRLCASVLIMFSAAGIAGVALFCLCL